MLVKIREKADYSQTETQRLKQFMKAKSGVIYGNYLVNPMTSVLETIDQDAVQTGIKKKGEPYIRIKQDSPTQSKFGKYRNAIIRIAKLIKYYGIVSLHEIDATILPKTSFHRPGSVEFFKLVEMNKTKEALSVLEEDRFQVFHYNESW